MCGVPIGMNIQFVQCQARSVAPEVCDAQCTECSIDIQMPPVDRYLAWLPLLFAFVFTYLLPNRSPLAHLDSECRKIFWEQCRLSQLRACSGHDTIARLPRLRMPVFVCGGEQDLVAPPISLLRMSEAIPGATLQLFEGGHLFLHQDAAAQPALARFLLGHSLSLAPQHLAAAR